MQRFQCNSALYSPPAPVCFLSVPCLPTRGAPHGITRNVCNGARNGGCEEAPTDCFCLLGMTSHRLHRSTQMVWVRKIIPQIEQNSQNLLLGMTAHRLHRTTQMVWVRKILPQIPQNSQNLLLGMTSHRLHRSTQMVWVRKILPQIPQNSQNLLLGMTSHGLLLLAGDDLPQIAQIYTDGLSAKDPPTDDTEFTEPSAGEYSPTDCTDWHRFVGCVGSPTDFTEFTEPLAWEETNTNNTNEKRPPRNSDAANFRGCTLTSVNSVKSVGESTHPNHLCWSAFYVKIQMFWPLFSF